MKRLIFTTSNDLNYDQRMQRICSTLQAVGYDCLLVGRSKKDSLPLSEKPFQQHRFSCWFESGKFFYLELNIRLYFYLRKQKADAICAVDFDTLPGAFNAAKNSTSKIVFDSHEYFEEVPELISRPKVKAIWERIGFKYISKVDLAYTVNLSIANIYKEKYKKSFEVIRNLPFPNLKAAQQVVDQKIVLYQGALNKGRGLEECIHAMKSFPELQLHIAGEGDLSEELRALVLKLNLSNQVKFLGFIRPDELRKITQSAWLGINVLKADSLNYYYSLANKFFDYLQAEVPHISMDFPEYQRINLENEVAILIRELSASSIEEVIQKLLDDPTYYQKLKSNCKDASEIYVWEKEGAKLIRLYEELLKSP